MSAGTTVEPAGQDLEPVLGRLWQLFSHDLSEFRDRPPDADGGYPVHRLPSFFTGDPARRPYVIRQGGALGGFALVVVDGAGLHHLDGLFVVRPLRRRGVAYRAAAELLLGSPGRWEIGFQEENAVATRFWRALAASLTTDRPGSHWSERSRPVPGKPWLPDDHVILLDLTARGRPA